MKNKNKPRRQKKKQKKPEKPFNPCVAKYFDLNGKGIDKMHKQN